MLCTLTIEKKEFIEIAERFKNHEENLLGV